MKTATRFSMERILTLDREIRAGRYPNARRIADRLEVSPRTIQRDVEFLRDRLGAPLAYDEVRHGYYYSEPGFRLPALTLSEGELVSIFLAERVLRQYRGTPFAPDLARAFGKIVEALDDPVTIDLGRLGDDLSFRTTAAGDADPSLFAALVAAIRRRRRVSLRYYSASSDSETAREVDPFHLACIDGQWYLVGFCHSRLDVRMFALGRIRAFEESDTSFEIPENFRIDEYLAGSFAALRGVEGERYLVRLRFTGEAVRYVGERTWHASQTTETTPTGDLLIGLEVSHLREVERWALSWGPDCLVLEPPELRERVARSLASASRRYVETPGRALDVPDPKPRDYG